MKKQFIPPTKQYIARILLSILGIAIIAAGTAIFILTDLGADPYQVLCNAVHVRLSVSQGVANMIVNGIIIIYIFVFNRKYINTSLLLSLLLSGVFIDIFIALLKTVINDSLNIYVRTALAVTGCILLAFGVYLYTAPKLGASPADSVGLILSEKLKKPYSMIRILTDVVYTLSGFLLGGKVGITTIISVLLTGPAIGLFAKLLNNTRIIRYVKPVE